MDDVQPSRFQASFHDSAAQPFLEKLPTRNYAVLP
jgi:hypothetical protein